jgi:AraC family transcriptional regulator
VSASIQVPGCRHNVDAVERVIAQMQEDLCAPLRLADLARTASFSPFHFHRVFRAVTGETPARFLAALRMARARWLLARTRPSVAVISAGVGYTSVGTFTTQFRRLVGLPPERFRRLAHRLDGLVIGRQPDAGRWGLAHPGLMVGEFRPLEPSGGPVRWGTADGGSPLWRVPNALAPGAYQVRILQLSERWPAMSALIDGEPRSYRVGTARLSVAAPAPSAAVVQAPLRAPAAIDGPVLSAEPVRLLADALQAETSGTRQLQLA